MFGPVLWRSGQSYRSERETVEEVSGSREEILAREHERRDEREVGSTIVPIDHHFTVKGIGPVILGIVRDGIVRRHQKLNVSPLGREVIVRSIQTS